jgi:dihydrodipicolinate synthase/N-acetylneuraminate lyase
MRIDDIPSAVLEKVRAGTVIPAHPLALDGERKLSEKHQRALTRYYLAAGAGGIAVGVHSTQFEIRDPDVALFRPVLELAAETMDEAVAKSGQPCFKVAGVCGQTKQAVSEAAFAAATGYHAVLLSLAALKDSSEDEMIAHCRAVAEVIPIIGFYLQPAVGGRILPYTFWRRFAEIENVIAIKMAPFNRYQTLDVIRGVCESGRENEVTLYTGNDDNIVIDLLTPYRIETAQGTKTVRIRGGLLGHWCVWTRRAVELLDRLHALVADGRPIPQEILTLAVAVTDTNAAFFDPAHDFAGCIPGIHEVLRRQGLMPGTWCLNPEEVLSPGQSAEIDRVYAAYPHLNDDEFVREHLDEWLEM